VEKRRIAEVVSRAGLILLMGGAIVLAGCSKGNQSKPGEPAKALTGQPGDEVARVDKSVITLGQVGKVVEGWKAGMAQDVDPNTPEAELQKKAVDQLISQTLLYEAAVGDGCALTDPEVKSTIDQMKQGGNLDDAGLEAALKQRGVTLEEFTQNIKMSESIRRYVKKAVQDTIKVTPEQAKSYFDAHPEQFQHPEQVRARHILLRVPPQGTPAQDAEAKQKADAIYAQLKKGADFEKMAQEKSEDGTSAKGGDLGFFSRGQMFQPFDSVAFATPLGQISEPFRTQFGYHIVRVEDKTAPGPSTFEQVQPQLMRVLYNQRTREVVNAMIDRLREKAKIRRKI
jgi:peptidyl-prolyl cis-trans isomerase C